MWAFAHAQKMDIPVSMVTAADTPIFRFYFFSCRIIEVPDNGGPDNRGSTVQWIAVHLQQRIDLIGL